MTTCPCFEGCIGVGQPKKGVQGFYEEVTAKTKAHELQRAWEAGVEGYVLQQRSSQAGGDTGDRSSALAGGKLVLQLDRFPRSGPPGPLALTAAGTPGDPASPTGKQEAVLSHQKDPGSLLS